MTVQTFSLPDMLQAQSLPDTGWPTYCLSPLYLLPQPHPSNPPPSAPLSLHHHSSSSTYLRELGGDQSFAGACMLLQPALLSTRWGSYLLDRRDGVTGAFLWGRSGWISCGETKNSKWHKLELRWSLSFSDKLTETPPGTFCSPFHVSSLTLRHQCTVLLFKEMWRRCSYY